MAGENTAIGSALVIPDSLFAKLDKMDEKLKLIQQSSEKTASVMTTAFSSMQGGTMSLEGAFNRLVDAISKINTAASSAGEATSRIGTGASSAASGTDILKTSITGVTDSLNALIVHLSETGSIGRASFTQAMTAARQLQEAMKFNDSNLIPELKAMIGEINKELRDKENVLTKERQDALIERKRQLQDELKEAERTNAERAINVQKTEEKIISILSKSYDEQKRLNDGKLKSIDEESRRVQEYQLRMMELQNRRAANAQKAYEQEIKAESEKQKAIERIAKAQEQFNARQIQEKQSAYSSVFSVDNVSVSGALTEAKYASSIQERVQAIKMLESARARLSTTDSDYVVKLERLNNEIKRLSAENRKAVESSKDLQQQQSRILDTVGQLKRAFALMFSVSQIKNFVASVAETRGYFELQQRSLQAIIQNRTKADEIFKLSLAQALDSRFTARELITYTKQLAAYRIETDKLFDTTKRLADVSAGLGVDMQRIILAYGQVKAAAYLRGTEVRQFTEAGINLYGELQSYFKEVKGEAYTTAQIVDMITKRKVTFEDVEQVFKRLTDEGGLFYNMQHIQVETLDGKLQKFKDTIEQMKNNLGVTYEGIFKGAVDGATALARSWEGLASVGMRLIEVLALMKITAMGSKMSIGAMIIQQAGLTKIAEGTGALARFSLGMKNFGSVIASTAKVAKASLASFWPFLLAIEAITALFNAYQLSQAKAEKNRSLLDEYSNDTAKITKLRESYEKLAKERENAVSKQDGSFDFLTNFNEKKEELKEIQNELDKIGLKLPVELQNVTQENIDSVAREAIKKLQTARDIALQAQREVTNIDYDYWKNEWISQPFAGETLSQNIKDYEKAAGDVINYSTNIRTSINLLGKNYDELSEKQKEYYNSIKDGAKEGESQLEYTKRSFDAITNILKDGIKFGGGFDEFVEQFKSYRNGLERQIGWIFQLDSQEETLKEQLTGIIDKLYNANKDYWDSLKPLELRTAWDKTAVDIGLSGLSKHLWNRIASEKFKFSITPDVTETEKQLDWVTEYINKYLAKQNFSVDISVNTNALQKWLDAGDELEKDANTVKKFLERQRNRKYRGANGRDVVEVDESVREFMGGHPLKIGTEIAFGDLTKRAEKLLKNQGKTLLDVFGINLNEKKTKSYRSNAAKQERDILSEQIELVTSLLNKYKELRKYKSASESVDVLKSYYASSIQYTKIGSNIIDRILENGEVSPEKVAVVIDNIAAKFKEVAKKNNALQKAADIRANVVVETDKKTLEESKRDVEDAFSALSMYRDLKKLGLNDVEIKKTFGELPKTFKDVQNIITATFSGREGEEWSKQREESEKKLAENIKKYNLDAFKELTKDYKTQLSEQLQLDIWYAEERAKIMKNVSDQNLQKQYLSNLESKYQEKTGDNIWKAFSSSESYINLFDNLEYYSKTVLEDMKERLVNIRVQLGKLNPTEVKQILEAEQKLNDYINKSGSYGKLFKNLKAYITLRRNVTKGKSAEKQARRDLQTYTQQLDIQSKIVAQKKVAANDSVDVTSEAWSEYEAARMMYEITKKNKEQAEKTVNSYDKQRKSLADILKILETNIQNLGKIKLGDNVEESISDITNSISGFASMLEESFGVYIGQDFKEILEGVGAFFGAVEGFDITKPISSTLNLLTGLGKSIGSIFGLGNGDDDLEKEIKRQQALIERLQRSYNKLKESMDAAWSSETLLQYSHSLEKNIEAQIVSLNAMIAAESDKKHTDKAKIQEWQDAIEDLNDSLEDLKESVTEAFGGIGEKNYKSAAEEFASAWLEAFNESENALDALNETFEDYFNTLLKKQILNRAAQRFLQPLFDAIDKAVSEGSAGGNLGTDVTESELKNIQDLANVQFEAMNDYVSALMNALNIKPSSQKSLSALQQGIQNITESQASAIESILNSMRFFAAQTAEDVSAIRRLLSASNSLYQNEGEQSLLLGELKTQTSVMNKLYSLLDSVIKPTGHRFNGGGIKVFMN